MGDLLVRGVDRPVADCWKEQARLARRSVHGEVETSLDEESDWWLQVEDFRREADEFRESLRGRDFGESADLIREDRDADYGRDP